MITSLFINTNVFNPSPASAQQAISTGMTDISLEIGDLAECPRRWMSLGAKVKASLVALPRTTQAHWLPGSLQPAGRHATGVAAIQKCVFLP